ncbi:MAG: STAS domain-containing protein [Bacteroidetes bacterium]|nr:STAS domain-containing protein [Bacteroidota bacterium]
MENLSNSHEPSTSSKAEIINAAKLQIDAEKKISDNVMSIRLTPDGLIINDGPGSKADGTHTEDQLPGVYCQGIMYYDLNNVHYINNTGMAILIDLLKSLLEMDVAVQFVNVDEKIKQKIKEMGLENIINC